jgi:hypothetical protein
LLLIASAFSFPFPITLQLLRCCFLSGRDCTIRPTACQDLRETKNRCLNCGNLFRTTSARQTV